MEQYISKTALVAEIEKRRKEAESNCGGYKSYNEHRCDACTVDFYNEFIEIINTLEAKEVGNTELLKVKGYLVRDKDDYTAIYAEKPHRGKTEWVNGNDSCLMTINDARLVPDIEFEDEPVEVEVTLKRV